eukprot:SAG22_NODE_2018_length_3130_cov_2.890135_1_plen_287_part_00
MHRSLALAALVAGAAANQYNVLFPKYIAPAECTNGCARWADVQADGVSLPQAAVAKLFANGTVPAAAGSSCLMPGSAPVHGEGRRLLRSTDPEDAWLWSMGKSAAENGSVPICLCKGGKGAQTGYCTAPNSVPEQLNLQYAAADVVVAAFVTYEKSLPAAPPVAMFSAAGEAQQQLSGVSHWYVAPGSGGPDRNYTLNFIKFDKLKPGTEYTYKVKSGAAGGAWSESFTFRSLRAGPDTRLGMYGDMGVSQVGGARCRFATPTDSAGQLLRLPPLCPRPAPLRTVS